MPDFADIPGLKELWTHTRGEDPVTIALLDGPVDLKRGCFEGANVTKIDPYWQEPVELDPKDIDTYREIQNSEEKSQIKKEKLKKAIPEELTLQILGSAFHATHVFSNFFGQPGSPVEGIAPKCRGINIPLGYGNDYYIDPINLARAINLALDLEANIIHCAACRRNATGAAREILEKAVRQAQEKNVLIVAPTGNDKGECFCIPAILPGVMSVGAMKDTGEVFKFSNWGGQYQKQGIIAPGENILGAQPGTEETVRQKGTSCSAAVVTGISALLMSLQLQQGASPDAEAVRGALTNSAFSCTIDDVKEPQGPEDIDRCLLGKLNLPGAYQLMVGRELRAIAPPQQVFLKGEGEEEAVEAQEINTRSGCASHTRTRTQKEDFSEKKKAEYRSGAASRNPTKMLDNVGLRNQTQPNNYASGITPSAASNLVYAIGTVGYDFGSVARRDSFKQLMPLVEVNGARVGANPYDTRQMADYLDANPYEAGSLIWTFNLELTPIYALKPAGAFGSDIYERLQNMLAGEAEAKDSEDYIERVSISGRLTEETVKLFSGQRVPVVKLDSPRGMYGWTINSLIESALTSIGDELGKAREAVVRKSLNSFLARVYYDLRNLGQTDRDRALNFAATNAFQATASISEAVAVGMELHSIEVEKSPFCRYDSNCWDVKLKFFDPDSTRRAKKVYRFTIDVIDLMPVTLGKVRSWSVPK